MSACRFLVTGAKSERDGQFTKTYVMLEAMDTLTAAELNVLLSAWVAHRPVTLTLEAVEAEAVHG